MSHASLEYVNLKHSMVQYSTLLSSLSENVLEIKFNRRRPRANTPATRRMLCTLNYNLLNSDKGKTVLNFKAPGSGAAYNPQTKGLVLVWDILLQDWRMVNTESCQVISTISATPPDKFWEYFNLSILPMSGAQKEAFINS